MLVEDLHSDLVDERVRDPGTVVAVGDLAKLVCADLGHSGLIRLGIVLDWDLRGHATHRRYTSPNPRASALDLTESRENVYAYLWQVWINSRT